MFRKETLIAKAWRKNDRKLYTEARLEKKMIYLKSFTFPSADMEFDFILSIRRTCYDSFYPFKILSGHDLDRLDFDTVTILYGGNGSGKSTALNVIAEKAGICRDSVYNKSNFFPDYVRLCSMNTDEDIMENSRIITSDDVFDYMLNIRNLNEGIDSKREELFDEYLDSKYSHFQIKSMADYEQLKKVNSARRKTQSRFVRGELMDNVREYSNGESAFIYFTEKIGENGLYLLDEPENSLSPKRQMELMSFLEDSHQGYKFLLHA
jgi:predicted ATPase